MERANEIAKVGIWICGSGFALIVLLLLLVGAEARAAKGRRIKRGARGEGEKSTLLVDTVYFVDAGQSEDLPEDYLDPVEQERERIRFERLIDNFENFLEFSFESKNHDSK